jgi:methyl-accepting chemotaxis protein
MERVFVIADNTHNSSKGMLLVRDTTVEKVENISAVSQEFSSIIEEVSSLTHEQLTNYEKLTNLSNTLKEMSNELNKALSSFHID